MDVKFLDNSVLKKADSEPIFGLLHTSGQMLPDYSRAGGARRGLNGHLMEAYSSQPAPDPLNYDARFLRS